MLQVSSGTAKRGRLHFTRRNVHQLKILSALGGILLFLAALPTLGLCAKRVGIVYSESSANQFFDKFAYSQLFMAMQHQAMMAGIPFDVLAEDKLANSANLTGYAALIIPPLTSAANSTAIVSALQTASTGGVGIITAANLLTAEATSSILGVAATASINGAAATVTAGDITHPALRDYTANEQIMQYSAIWTNSYQPVAGQQAVTLAKITASSQVYNAVLATVKGGRNVHFGNDQLMGDCNLVWSALQWVVYGDNTPVGLKMGRSKSIFTGRTDMDSSMYYDDLPTTDIPLLDLLTTWKQSYNYVGSYYINIGNNSKQGEYTDWQVSGPLFAKYIALGNEIGTHSYTHPDDTTLLSSTQLEFEFNQSKSLIGTQLGINVLGAAIPGNPENLTVDSQLNNYFEYLSGRASVIGSGYPCAFGYLSPSYHMLYFSLNLFPEFTLIDWLGYTPAQATQIWADEYKAVLKHASQPIVHWLWHDYGPTEEAAKGHYTVAMYQNTLALAYNSGSEFVTGADLEKRIRALQAASLEVTQSSGTLTATVAATDVGQFSLAIPSNQIITSVDNWYAYDEDQVFLPGSGGQFVIRPGTTQTDLTHIAALPMRAKLVSVSGDGTQLSYTFEGEGNVAVKLNSVIAAGYNAQGADSTTLSGTTLTMKFNTIGTHTAAITLASSNNHAPVATAQALTAETGVALPITLTASDADNDPLSMEVTTSPSHGTLSGTSPFLTYTSTAGFVGSDSFQFVANDGLLKSSPATISITVNKFNQAPVATAQSVTTTAGTSLAITLTGSDPNGDPLTMKVTTSPSHGTLSGTPPLLTYTPTTGFVGSDSFQFVANDGALDSSPATVSITVGSKVNHAPVATAQSLTTTRNTPLAITLTASDPDGDALTMKVTRKPTHGTLSGTVPKLTYKPYSSYTGSDSFRFVATDSGGLTSNTATISITVKKK